MRYWAIALFTCAASAAITDVELQQEARRIVQKSAQEPPLMALDTILQTATLLHPYVPAESQRLLEAAKEHARRNSALRPSYSVVRMWMKLDPEKGEAGLRAFQNKRPMLEALMGYYNSIKRKDRAVEIAIESMRLEEPGVPTNAAQIVAEMKPLELVALLDGLKMKEAHWMVELLLRSIDGLITASATQPEAVKTAAAKLAAMVEKPEFLKDADVLLTTQFTVDGRKVDSKDTRTSLLETLRLVDMLTDPARRTVAQAALQTREYTQKTIATPANGFRPPVDGSLPLNEAVARIRQLQPEYQQLGELWRYIQGKARTGDETQPILETMIEWSKTVETRSDPGWFLQSLLNLDGRLGPPGKQWVLPSTLRPMVFAAAARANQRMDRAPEQLAALVEAFGTEGVPIPEDAASALTRKWLADLKDRLEERYDFALPGTDGKTSRLSDYRGKVVLVNFWATWCAPCRAELPVLEKLSRATKGIEVLAISDDSTEKMTAFLDKNPVALRVLRDESRETFQHYGVVGIPQTVVIGKHGQIVKRFKQEANEGELRAAIDRALSAPIGH